MMTCLISDKNRPFLSLICLQLVAVLKTCSESDLEQILSKIEEMQFGLKTMESYF